MKLRAEILTIPCLAFGLWLAQSCSMEPVPGDRQARSADDDDDGGSGSAGNGSGTGTDNRTNSDSGTGGGTTGTVSETGTGSSTTTNTSTSTESGPACTLVESGPVEATTDGQVIENLRITSSTGPAVRVSGKSGVIIRNVEILHAGGYGISLSDAPGTEIRNVSILHTGAPAVGKNSSENRNNIDCYQSDDVTISNVRLARGSSGVYLNKCRRSRMDHIEGHDFRGPMPRGQLVQFNASHDGRLEDFSCENPATSSWVEDNISAFNSSGIIVRRGLIDGNNSPSGVGVMFEQLDAGVSGGLVEDVDAVRMGNGCFSGYPAHDVIFRRTRCRDNICTNQGRGLPLSGGLGWTGSPEASGLRIESSIHYRMCHTLIWDQSSFALKDLVEADFTLRTPQRLKFCWQ